MKTSVQKFKEGDWVVHTEAEHPWRISQNSLNHLDNTELKLWEPQPDEWCWFWEIDSNPKLCQYSNYINEEFEALSIDPYYELEGHFGFCEPFIGTLPSYLQNRKKKMDNKTKK